MNEYNNAKVYGLRLQLENNPDKWNAPNIKRILVTTIRSLMSTDQISQKVLSQALVKLCDNNVIDKEKLISSLNDDDVDWEECIEVPFYSTFLSLLMGENRIKLKNRELTIDEFLQYLNELLEGITNSLDTGYPHGHTRGPPRQVVKHQVVHIDDDDDDDDLNVDGVGEILGYR